MSQVYDEDNNLVPVTIVEAGPCPILQVKSLDKDGYESIQIGFNPKGKAPTNLTSVKSVKRARQMLNLSIYLKRSVLRVNIALNKVLHLQSKIFLMLR